jgi:acetylornithine deacetylase
VDPLNLVAAARQIIDIDSTTGREGEVGRAIAAWLEGRGWRVTRQPVDASRFNVVATAGNRPPFVTLSTHFDCVPPFFPSRLEGDRLYGRGACDAKGILVAQVAAAERLRAAGRDDVALLFVVGEERGSEGAAAANAAPLPSAFLINGEPTDNRLGLATRGVLRVRLAASGRAAHSSFPELGESAIERLIDALVALRGIDLPEDQHLGRTHYTVGVIDGGVAPNVVPPSASAEVMFRTVGPHEAVRHQLSELSRWVAIEDVLANPPVRLVTVPGFDTAVFPFTTDIQVLTNWGRPLLYGPGSIHVAHTDHEHVRLADLERAVEDYVRLVGSLPDQR